MKIPFLSGLKVNGKVELNNLSLLSTPTKILTIDEFNNITYSTSVGGTVDLSNYYNKSQTDTNISNAIAGLVNSAPSTLDTLNELATALGNDPNFATTITTLIGTKANSSDVYSKSASDARYKAITWLPTWNDVLSRPTNLSQFTNDLGLSSIYQPLENQRLSSSNNVIFNQITANSKLNIPSTSSNKYSLYVDENGIGGTGSTINIISYLNDLSDVTISSPVNGNVLMYNGSEWINSTFTSGTYNYNDLINKPDLSVYAYVNGSNASGTWGINISGAAKGWGSSLNEYDGDALGEVNTYLMGFSSTNKWGPKSKSEVQAFVDINNGSTLNNNISGNSAKWGNRTADFDVTPVDTGVAYIPVFHSGTGANVKTGTRAAIRDFLGLTNGAYDLQWVTNNGAVTPNPIFTGTGTGVRGNNPYFQWQNAAGTRLGYIQHATNLTIAADVGDISLSNNTYVDGKLYATRIGGDGSSWGTAQFEVQGANPGIGFHYPGVYGASLYMSSEGRLRWTGDGMRVSFVDADRLNAGYDSGQAGSVNASNWFRSTGNSGWFNSDYAGGIYMEDSTWVRTYNYKGFLATTIRATNNMELPVKDGAGTPTGNYFSIWVEA